MRKIIPIIAFAVLLIGCGGEGGAQKEAPHDGNFPSADIMTKMLEGSDNLTLYADSISAVGTQDPNDMSAAVAIRGMGNTNALTLSMTAVERGAVAFEGSAAKKLKQLTVMRSDGTEIYRSIDQVFYQPTPYTYLGSVGGNGEFELAKGKTKPIPATVRIGDTGYLYKSVVWENSDKRKKSDRRSATWNVQEGENGTALFCVDTKSNQLEASGSYCVGLDRTGAVVSHRYTINTISDGVDLEIVFKNRPVPKVNLNSEGKINYGQTT